MASGRLIALLMYFVALLYAAVDMYSVCPGLVRFRVVIPLGAVFLAIFVLTGE